MANSYGLKMYLQQNLHHYFYSNNSLILLGLFFLFWLCANFFRTLGTLLLIFSSHNFLNIINYDVYLKEKVTPKIIYGFVNGNKNIALSLVTHQSFSL